MRGLRSGRVSRNLDRTSVGLSPVAASAVQRHVQRVMRRRYKRRPPCSRPRSPPPSSSSSTPRRTGKAGDACELTEVGAVLVGGGELHDRWETLVGVRAPLSRGIQRFTGITQAMVDEAPAAELVLPDLAELSSRGRVLVGAQRRRSTGACCARRSSARAWSGPTRRRCARSRWRAGFAPLARQRKLAALADVARHRRRGLAPRARRRRDVRARVLRAVPAAVRERGDGRRGARAAAPRAAARARGRDRRRAARRPRARRALRRPDFADLPDEPGVYIFRNAEGQALYVGKSVTLRTRARSHFAPSARDAATGPRRRRSSTTARRTPSSARCCSRTG